MESIPEGTFWGEKEHLAEERLRWLVHNISIQSRKGVTSPGQVSTSQKEKENLTWKKASHKLNKNGDVIKREGKCVCGHSGWPLSF